MASGSGNIILGFVDEQIKPKYNPDCITNKIGGLPDWNSNSKIPICKKCNRKQSLVTQIYAPLENTVFHRTLYVFACISQECWDRPHSWTCLRQQKLDVSYIGDNSTKSSTTPATSMLEDKWFDDDDDWGDNDNGNNLNLVSNKLSYLDNASDILREKSSNLNLNKVSPTISSVTKSLQCHLNINKEDDNANEPVCGAIGVGTDGDVAGMDEASAILEGPEGDMIAVDTPERPATDIPALFKEAIKVEPNVDAVFTPYFVSTHFEPLENTDYTEHERELLVRYTHSTGHQLQDDDMSMDTQVGGDGVYEKDKVVHGDTFIYKFKKRVAREPSQILRYCRGTNSLPLLLYESHFVEGATKCSHCKGALVFEAQVMPQLVNFLRIPGIKEAPLEFGTILIYTCKNSCWDEKDVVRQEVVIVQSQVL